MAGTKAIIKARDVRALIAGIEGAGYIPRRITTTPTGVICIEPVRAGTTPEPAPSEESATGWNDAHA